MIVLDTYNYQQKSCPDLQFTFFYSEWQFEDIGYSYVKQYIGRPIFMSLRTQLEQCGEFFSKRQFLFLFG